MKYRQLGTSGMRVSAVSLGGWINFGEGKVEQDIGTKIIETAYENGINFFDIADIYGKGKSETQMGEVLAQFPRHTLVISSKVYWPMSDDTNDRGLSRKHIMESIDKSLERIGTDYLDIYFCHRYDENTPVREIARAMNDLIESGKVLYWGTSEWPAIRIQEAYEICDRYGWHLPQIEQANYSMLYRERVEDEIMPVTNPRGIGIVPFSPLAQGMLTGKYDDGIPEDSRFAREEWAKKRIFNDENANKVHQLKPIADELGITRAQLALAWLLRHPLVSSVITGATKPEQVIANVKAVDVELNSEQFKKIDHILSGESLD